MSAIGRKRTLASVPWLQLKSGLLSATTGLNWASAQELMDFVRQVRRVKKYFPADSTAEK
jgi:hypothetical protein